MRSYDLWACIACSTASFIKTLPLFEEWLKKLAICCEWKRLEKRHDATSSSAAERSAP